MLSVCVVSSSNIFLEKNKKIFERLFPAISAGIPLKETTIRSGTMERIAVLKEGRIDSDNHTLADFITLSDR
ncbi:hypothetical protein ACFL42_04985, partial [Candidatus Omnitrophota bacterium]